MDALALLLSRLQFAFTISFHIIFPAFSIGLAAWLTILEAVHLTTGRPSPWVFRITRARPLVERLETKNASRICGCDRTFRLTRARPLV